MANRSYDEFPGARSDEDAGGSRGFGVAIEASGVFGTAGQGAVIVVGTVGLPYREDNGEDSHQAAFVTRLTKDDLIDTATPTTSAPTPPPTPPPSPPPTSPPTTLPPTPLPTPPPATSPPTRSPTRPPVTQPPTPPPTPHS